ncbi:glutamate--cysteine ligase [Alginatibacterium sediminis]|uniref:Glutamate--cysteine ligase n=2 Tax=Alginatibacterium sediminis TaxID=2164068 RepID=A0A420EA33_9ALTE|nr:glutamate--cysteine ligase [Alginatibacterium sediminis]
MEVLSASNKPLLAQSLSSTQRGIEREALRIEQDGSLATDPHPQALGKALTHPYITTDFSESLLEFITPVTQGIDPLMEKLADIHRFTLSKLNQQALWPLSMPCVVRGDNNIVLADYGQSNIGKMKHVYRRGLSQRYGSMMQVISGVHYNISFSQEFWKLYQQQLGDKQELQDFISQQYMGLIRNFYRYGWFIAYAYGASPALCGSFVKGMQTSLDFQPCGKGSLYLPFATSLRLSDLGYTSDQQRELAINYNSVECYVDSVRKAVKLESEEFSKLGVKVGDEYQQLNSHVLQIENELYAPIRAKRVAKEDETPSQALARGGIEYIEIRALDVNPFSSLGIEAEQIEVIDQFLLWCLMTPSPELSQDELNLCRENFNHIAVEGRDPKLEISIQGETHKVSQWLERIFSECKTISQQLELTQTTTALQHLQDQLDSDQSFSARLLKELLDKQQDNSKFGLDLSRLYREQLRTEALSIWTPEQFELARFQSEEAQLAIENQDQLDFDHFLEQYFVNAAQY